MIKGVIMQIVLAEKGVEAAKRAVVRQFYAWNIEGNRTNFRSVRQNIAGAYEQKFGVLVDEPPHQPGTGDAINLGPFSRNPFHVLAAEVRTSRQIRTPSN